MGRMPGKPDPFWQHLEGIFVAPAHPLVSTRFCSSRNTRSVRRFSAAYGVLAALAPLRELGLDVGVAHPLERREPSARRLAALTRVHQLRVGLA